MDIIRQRLQESVETKKRIIENPTLVKLIEDTANMIVEQFRAGKSVYFCGNGGSAADAQHLAAELSGRFYFDRPPLSADALHGNTSFLTAVGNDYSFDIIYARLLQGIGREGDVLIGLSTSGNSKNIVEAVRKARELGIKTVAMTGESGGELKNMSDICLCVPSTDTPRIQESHITIGHIICEIVESALFDKE